MISRWYILIGSVVMALCATPLWAASGQSQSLSPVAVAPVVTQASTAGVNATESTTASAVTGETSNTAPNTLVVLGDSLSAAHNIPVASGWVQLLAERIAARGWRVVNASISGETSGGGAARITDLLDQHQPQALIVELGGNDGLRGLPIGQFRANLSTIIEQARQAGAKVLITGIQIPTNYGPVYRRRFEGVYTQLSEQFHVPLVPFLLENIAQHKALMQNDGIHPTAEAQPIIVENLWPYLQPLLETNGAATVQPTATQQ